MNESKNLSYDTDKKELVRQSLDVRALKREIKIEAIFVLIITTIISTMAVIIFWSDIGEMVKAIAFYLVLWFGCYIPLIAMYLIKQRRLIKRSNSYIFSDARLSEMHCSRGTRFYFTVTCFDGEKNIRANTDDYFTSKINFLNIEEWNDKNVLVAYDTDYDKVVVIGLRKNFILKTA